MKNLYHIYFQRVLIFCALLLSSQLSFAQVIDAPTDVTNNQTFCSSLSVTLQATCAEGNATWLDKNNIYVTDLNISLTDSAVYQVYCKAISGLDSSASVLVTFDELLPVVTIRNRIACPGEKVRLSATCSVGEVFWYGSDTTQPALGTGDIDLTLTSDKTFNVQCSTSSGTPCITDFVEFSFADPTAANILSEPDPSSTIFVCEGESFSLSASCQRGMPFIFKNNEVEELSNPITPASTGTSIYKVRCEDGNNCPSTFTSYTVQVIARSPATVSTPVSVFAGEYVSLGATCTGTFTPKWYLNDEVTPLASTTIIAPNQTTTYKVRCEMPSLPSCNGGFSSYTVTILDYIDSQPVSTLICLGDAATFNVSIVDIANVLNYQWQKRQPSGVFADIPGAMDSTFTILNTTLADKGYYRCRIQLNMPDTTLYSNEAFLSFPQTIRDNGQVTPSSITLGDDFGNAIAISDSLAVIGAVSKDLGTGSVFIYKLNPNGKWTQVTELMPADLIRCDQFGSSIAISGDTIFVSAPCKNDAGVVYVFARQAGDTWVEINKMQPTAGAINDYYGISMGISQNTLVIGADGRSSVFVYQKNNSGEWDLEQEIVSNGGPNTRFGTAVGISGQTIVVGAPDDGTLGAIYAYEKDETNTWVEKLYSVPDSLSINSFYGDDVAISGNTIIASSYNPLLNSNKIYYYERSVNGNWQLIGTLNTDTLTYHANAGYSLAIRDNTIVVGAPNNNDDRGAVIVFEKDAANIWQHKKVIIPDNLANGDYYGASVALGKNAIIVGAPFYVSISPTVIKNNSAYFYSLNTSPKPGISTVAQVASVCAGQTATFRLTGLPSTDAYTITYKIDISGALKTRIINPDSTGRATFTDTLAWVNNAQSIYITKVKNNVSNCEQAISLQAVVAVKTPTQIITNPSPQTVCLYETALFTAEATGEGLLTYQWQRQGPIAGSANAPLNNNFADLTMLSLPYRTFADSGATYKVRVTGECGVVTSTAAMLRVVPKAVVTGSSPGPICPGTFGTINFVGTSNADVYYKVNTPGSTTHSIRLDVNGRGFITTSILTQDTDYMIVSVSLNGKCQQQLSTIVKVEVKPSGMNPPITLTSPSDDVLPSGVQNRLAQSVQALNKIDNTGRATHTGNKYVLLSPGFEAKSGSTYIASISAACP
ncbi:3-coathanger stack domain-containing protein [Emticicia soli]|uniref:3-coathanger stack domain-containing protein n=1 Tax=Emticicia soli TaxID=2027878 RepID=A0ABW5JB72_9BACT